MQQLSFSQHALVWIFLAGAILLTVIYASIIYLLVSKVTDSVVGKITRIPLHALHPRRLCSFLWEKHLWWMIPLVVGLLLLAALIAFSSATFLGPYIYPLI